MSLFAPSKPDPQLAQILGEVEKVQRDLAALKGERQAVTEANKLEKQLRDLKVQIAEAHIERDRQKETHEREKRDVEHMVGLERKRQEFEINAAKRETTITVREENLKAERQQFEEQMQFMTKRMETEVGYLREIAGQLMERLPTVEVNKSVSLSEAKKGAA